MESLVLGSLSFKDRVKALISFLWAIFFAFVQEDAYWNVVVEIWREEKQEKILDIPSTTNTLIIQDEYLDNGLLAL